jgi:tRNA pseudouridine38-40 synthase
MGALRVALESTFRQEVDFAGAGRTDSGVHARGQVAHVRVQRPAGLPPASLLQELNAALPADIAALRLEPAPLHFHARHDAIARAYVYQIARRKTAFDKKFVWWIKEPLDIAAMREAATHLIGRHDFRHFQAIDPSKPKESSLVAVERAGFEVNEDLLLFQIEASHFLWRMVRRLTGVLVHVGLGDLSPAEFRELLNSRQTPRFDVAAWTAPASGLFLQEVHYRQDPRK